MGSSWSMRGSITTYFSSEVFDLEIGVTSNNIEIWINGDKRGSFARSDTFPGGYVGFSRMTMGCNAELCSNSTAKISPIWIINNFIGAHPQIEIVGNPDIEIKRTKPEPQSGDYDYPSKYRGIGTIESVPRSQICQGYVDGNTFDKYIYRAYQMASKDQIFEYSVKMWNRGNEADTFTVYITDPTDPQKELDLKDWNLAYKYGGSADYVSNLPGGTSTLRGTITSIPAGGSYELSIIAVPGEKTLFNGGKLDFTFNVEGRMDMCVDGKIRLKCPAKA